MKLRVAKTLLVFIILIVLFLFIAVSFLIAKFDQNHNHDGIALAVVDGNWTYDLKDNISQSAGYSDLTTYLNGTYNKEIKYENLNSGQISNFTYTFDAIPLKKPSETANPSVTPWMEYAYNNTYNETEFKKDNMTGTPHSTAQNGSPDGSNIDVGIGSSKKTLAGKMVRFYTIISYNLNITFDDTLIEAMKNNRVEFRLTQCNLTDLYLGQTEKDLQFSYVSTDSGVSISDLKNAINTDYNSTELKTFYSRGLENETINFPGPGIEIKYTNKDINYIDNNDDNWFTPTFSLNDKNITIQLQTSHSNEPDDWYTKGTYCYITTPPVIVLSMRYKLSEIEFKVNNTNYGSIVAPDQGGSHTYEVDLESKYNGVTLAATAVSKNGYAFLYWTSQQNVGDNYFSPELSVIPLYEHNKNDDSGGKITYEAVFEQIRFTDLLNEQHSEYYYTNTGQGPRAYLAYAFGEGVTNKVTHKYGDDPSQSKDVTTTSSASISGFDQIKPKVVGQYKYSVTFYRLIEINQNYTYVSVGETTTNYEIKKHTPSASTDIIQLDPYYYGQKLTTSIIKLADGSNNAYVSDTKVQGIDSKIQGKFWFADNEYNSGETRLKTTRYGVQIKFIPTDTININEIILDNTVTLTVLKTTLKLGYLNENALIPGLEGLNLNVINYGQLRTDLGITDKIILYNEYTYNDSNALSDPYFGYVPYTISDWGGIQNRPASTTLTTVNLSFALNSYIGESQTSYSSVYNLPLGNITIGYTVNKAKLVFEVLNEKVIKYQYNHYLNYMNENVLSTVYNNENIELMYGQGLKVINISSTGKINSNVPSYIDTGTIRFSWYSQVGGVIGDSLTDYYEQKLLNVSDSTNPSNTQNPKYYCLKAEWMNVDGNAVNTNYEPYYMYNQSIIIVKAKLNESIDFAQSTESGNPDITVVRPIIYGTSVNSALSQNYNIGTTLNLINKDLEVYYKIEWIVDKQSGSVANLENYPYALVSDSASYPVQITVYKKPISGSDWIIDDDNYEQNGVFTRNENGQPFSYAKLTVNHAEQEFYVMVGDELAALNNANLTKSLVEYNDYIYEETTVGLKIGSDTNIDIETLYVDGKNTFNIILYTSAVIYKGDNQFADINGVNKAGVTITPLDPLNYNNIVFSTATYSLEYFNGTPYTRINLILTLAPNAKTTPGVVSFVLGQYDSGHELTNPIGGNYKSKEWNPLQLVGDPYTLFIKLNKKPTGLKAASIKNPDDNTDTRLYSYSVTYGDYVEITPGAQVKGSLECAEEYNQIEIVDQSDEVEKYYILASATGAYNLIYTAPGHVDTSKPLSNPYMPVSENIWIYVAKKSANVNLALVDNNAFSITYGTLSPEFKFEEGLYFAGDDFSYIKKVIKLITLGVNSEDYISGLVLPVNTYYIGALIDLESNTIEGLSSDELANARDIANRYKITFNAGEFVVTQKKVTITFTDSSQYTEGGDGKIFEIDYFDDKLLDANTYPYLYEFNGILESENLDDVIGNSTTRPSVRAMTTTDSISYYPISARPDAGSYEIKLYVPVNCPAVNYEFDIERAILRVKTRDVTLDFDEVEQDYTSTSYTFANNAKVSGIKGATSPTGNLIIKFLKTGTVVSENTEFLISLQHAGVYDVYVSYLSGNLDNYNDTDKVFSEYIIINRIDPIVTLPSHNSTYDGIQITYPYNIRGIAADYTLPGETLVYYSTNGSDYSES
ncbi:MAG: hypothetical protein LBF12_04465, partial [Christensenellaceae bacterium]|nr:hypothetical protein [Christensenellaceae bacterium]